MGQSLATAIDESQAPLGRALLRETSCSALCQLYRAAVEWLQGPSPVELVSADPLGRSLLLPGGGDLAHSHSSLETPLLESITICLRPESA